MRKGREGWEWEGKEDSWDDRGLSEIKTGRLNKYKERVISNFFFIFGEDRSNNTK